MAESAFHILFLAPRGMTDAILASGLLKRLSDEVDNAAFTVVAGDDTAALFRELPGLEALIPRGRPGFAGAFALWNRLRRRRWGLVLDPDGLRLSGLLPSRRKARPRSTGVEPGHRVLEAARLLKLEDEPPAPFLFTSPETQERAVQLVGDGGPLLAVAPAAPWIGQAWPVERFARAAVHLLSDSGPLPDGRLLIVGGPQDWKAAESLRRSVPRERWIDLTGESDPLVVYAALARARLYIGSAIAVTHMAAAAGAPTLGLYGPNDEAREGTWGEHSRVVRGPRSFAAIRTLDPKLDRPVCHMLDLKIESVLEAAERLLSDTAPKERRRGHG